MKIWFVMRQERHRAAAPIVRLQGTALPVLPR
jgi:hypothetical protein